MDKNFKTTRKANRRAPPVERKMPVGDAISEAFGELTGLGEEMRSWADSLEEKFSSTEKYERVTEAADALENLSEPDIPDSVKNLEVTFVDPPQRRRGYSRADRCAQACYILEQCIGVLDEFVGEDDEKLADAIELKDAIEQAKDEAEGVEFPGMYG